VTVRHLLTHTAGIPELVRPLQAETGRLLGELIGAPPDRIRTDVPQHPDDEHDPYGFRVDLSAYDLGTARVVFTRAAGTTRIHTDVVPLVLEKRRRTVRRKR
jgi:CubicO group peptidase (beta-lactamase class C family)